MFSRFGAAARAVPGFDACPLAGSKEPDTGQKGDRPEWAELYAEFQPLVQRLLRQHGRSAEQRRALKAGMYGRFRALLAAYDPAGGVPFRPYLVRSLTAWAAHRAGPGPLSPGQEGRPFRSTAGW